MANTIENLFLYITAITDLLVVLLFFFLKKVRKERGLQIVAIYCLSSLVLNLIGITLLPKVFEYIFYTSFTLVEYLIFTSFFWFNIKNSNLKKFIVAASSLFVLFIIGYLAVVKHQSIDSLSIGIETILIFVYIFSYLYEEMNNTRDLFIYNKYQFWVTTGILIYLAGSFFIYIFANEIKKDFLIKYWFLTNVFYIIKNVFFVLGILIFAKNNKKTSYNYRPYKLTINQN